MSSFVSIQKALQRAGVDYAVIGAHAVNAWVEPRFTSDFDITVQAGQQALERLEKVLAQEGLTAVAQEGADQPAGPDFVRFTSRDGSIDLEVQIARTEFQSEAITRARTAGDLRVATPEDLIVMKLIAYRTKDRADLAGLVELPDVDWDYVERWAAEWDVSDRLARVRGGD
ncbi:hypothetical protein LCGC14_1831140 [marine sediment metagenome]|uniref:Uncharacterized protein n=1 Tax=marine sediment metagenome TaxID=412755 RepID=A0A0F9GG45_9ZZZZ